MLDLSPDRYPTDLTDEQWALIEPMVPARGGWPAGDAPTPADRRGDPVPEPDRVPVAAVPHDLPPWDTVSWYFYPWREGTADRMHDALRDARPRRRRPGAVPLRGDHRHPVGQGRRQVGRNSRGFDAGKKVNGRKRHVVVDTIGLLVVVLVTAAGVQDRDGARLVLVKARMAMPSLCWSGPMAVTPAAGRVGRPDAADPLHIVRKPAGSAHFEVLPRRWVVERTLSWLVRCRRLDRDYERLPSTTPRPWSSGP